MSDYFRKDCKVFMKKIKKIISGAQTGVDRAALDFARAHNIPIGGYVPKGGRALDMIDGDSICNYYPELIELDSPNYPPRTAMNVKASDATLICYPIGISEKDRGTKLTIKILEQYKKPYFVIDGKNCNRIDLARKFLNGVPRNLSLVLNIAGPREIKNTSIIYDNTLLLLEKVFFL